jgi:hypothetical protein
MDKRNKVSMSVKAGAKARQPWQLSSTAWTCVLRCEGRQMTVPFFMGSGHNGREPEVDEVLDAMLSDAAMADGLDATMWAAECGFSSEDAWEPIYKSVVRQTEKLKRLLGENYNTYMGEV